MGLLRMFERALPAARFPDGRVGFAVGDIHGRADLLTEMLDLLEERAEEERRDGGEPVVVFLGDYVDRGPHSPAVIDLLLQGRPHGYRRHYLKGNHEQSMLKFMQAPLENRAWVLQGGAETLVSYGVQPPPQVAAEERDWISVAAALNVNVPQAHLDFLNSLERYVVYGDYAFVHAGVDAARTLEEQTDEDLYWSRDRFIASRRRFSHRVVHGHTPVDRPYADERRVAVDTGAYASGTLTAARFEGADVAFLSVSDRNAFRPPAPATPGRL
ncbi:MAG TPA: metallophosphoesterase family protein [Vitreimonas sp.]|jgi:serine/threonine protein phosphatase 1|nr:metallophosphoesterase family protein [Vitreimonas sp.]